MVLNIMIKGFKFEVGDHVRISKYKKILQIIALHIRLKNFLPLKFLKILSADV